MSFGGILSSITVLIIQRIQSTRLVTHTIGVLPSIPVKCLQPLLAIDFVITSLYPVVQLPLSKTMYGVHTQSSLQSTNQFLIQFCRKMCKCSTLNAWVSQHPLSLSHQLYSYKLIQQMSSIIRCLSKQRIHNNGHTNIKAGQQSSGRKSQCSKSSIILWSFFSASNFSSSDGGS